MNASPMDDAAEQSVREEHLAGKPWNLRIIRKYIVRSRRGRWADSQSWHAQHGQQHATPPTLHIGSQSELNGEIDLQTLIAIALAVATGLVVVGHASTRRFARPRCAPKVDCRNRKT